MYLYALLPLEIQFIQQLLQSEPLQWADFFFIYIVECCAHVSNSTLRCTCADAQTDVNLQTASLCSQQYINLCCKAGNINGWGCTLMLNTKHLYVHSTTDIDSSFVSIDGPVPHSTTRLPVLPSPGCLSHPLPPSIRDTPSLSHNDLQTAGVTP